ncbi:DUF2971 domain-containing protein [Kluyvera georgiana]|uniref:DUF2971 domain-containing protein n=1 Tax=Kluyvera georgiana TaxID=73098 RepID=UPI00321FA3E7
MAKKPKHLYKYLAFNENTLNLICMQLAYYSDPANFNDPLDCQPIVKNDLPGGDIKDVFVEVMLKKSEKQFSSTLKSLRFSKEKREIKALSLAGSEVHSMISNLEYYATEYNLAERDEYLSRRYISAIQDEIVNTFKTGVLCLSSKFNSPLMWSHYANQHKGLCIEYDMDLVSENHVHKVIYGGSRQILTSEIRNWLREPSMDDNIKKVCLLTKSEEWRYESEWRIFGKVGLGNSLPPIKSIIFGLKCDDVTIFSVMKSMMAKDRVLKFWKIVNKGDGFDLKRELINPEDYFEQMPCLHSGSEIAAEFEDLVD